MRLATFDVHATFGDREGKGMEGGAKHGSESVRLVELGKGGGGMSHAQRVEQRSSFVYGNTKMEEHRRDARAGGNHFSQGTTKRGCLRVRSLYSSAGLAVDHNTALEVENGFRQFDLTIDIIKYYLEPERPFALRVPLILDLQKEAVNGIEAEAGEIRRTTVGISKSKHVPPEPHLVGQLLTEFCEYVNDNWHEKTAFYLSAYAMWRLNWIYPFSDGNGRTSRAVSYALLSIKLRLRTAWRSHYTPAD